MGRFVDYYALLDVDQAATTEMIKTAHKKCLDDLERMDMSQSEKAEMHRLYEAALFILGNPTRRGQYDSEKKFLRFDLQSLSDSQRHIPGIPVLLVWGGLIVAGIIFWAGTLLLRGHNAFTNLFLLNAIICGSFFIINSILVGGNIKCAWNVRYPLRESLFRDKFRIIYMKVMTPMLLTFLLVSFSHVVLYWLDWDTRTDSKAFQTTVFVSSFLGILIILASIALIYSAYSGDDFINN